MLSAARLRSTALGWTFRPATYEGKPRKVRFEIGSDGSGIAPPTGGGAPVESVDGMAPPRPAPRTGNSRSPAVAFLRCPRERRDSDADHQLFTFGQPGRAAAVATVLVILIIPVMFVNIRRFQSQEAIR